MNLNTEQQLIDKWRNLLLDKQQQVLKFVDSLDQQKLEIKQRPFGLCKGEFVVPDNFNEPLPDDILDLLTIWTIKVY